MSATFILQDQVYINHLREALWGRSISFASVMVGAGFSLNATPIRMGLARMPIWGELDLTGILDRAE